MAATASSRSSRPMTWWALLSHNGHLMVPRHYVLNPSALRQPFGSVPLSPRILAGVTEPRSSDSAGLCVVMLLSGLARGGAQRQAVLTAVGLRRRGHDVSVVTLRRGGDLAADLRAAHVPLIELGRGGALGGLAARVKLLLLPALRDADVVYSYMPAASVTASLVGLVRRRVPVVWGIRDSGLDLARYGRATRVMSWLADHLAWQPRRIICNSHVAFEHYAGRGYPTGRMVVIPNGIDVERFQPDDLDRAGTRAALGIPAAAKVVLCLARVDPMKGHLDLVQAFSEVLRSGHDARLLLVGDHDEQFASDVSGLAADDGYADRLMICQGTDRPESMIRAADLLVVPSRYGEGFSNVLGEALACGVPVVATDVGDARVVVGEDGTVVPPGDVERLTNAIEDALSESTDRRSRRRSRILHEFSLERLVDRTEHELLAVARR